MTARFDVSKCGLFAGPLVASGIWLFFNPADLSQAGLCTLAISLWMAIWWATEAIPIPITALMPIFLMPVFGINSLADTARAYGHPVVFLFLGGFILALAMERWHLHRRIALNIVRLVGGSNDRLVGGFILAAGAMSMWVTNTATTLMMLPIALSVIEMKSGQHGTSPDLEKFGKALLLGLAYASTAGGLATLVGTVPNALLAAFVEENYGLAISFTDWFLVGFPLSLVLLPTIWLLLTKVVFRCNLPHDRHEQNFIKAELAKMGSLSAQEKKVLAVLVIAAAGFIFRPLINQRLSLNMRDTEIAIAAAVALYVIPSSWKRGEFLMNWEWGQRIPWDILLLFGGGLALAGAIKGSGLSVWIGGLFQNFAQLPPLVVIALVAAIIMFLTELTSNIATTATFLPVVAALAAGAGQKPLLLLFPMTIAASCAFMLPVATPPNAIVFGSHKIAIKDMIRAGYLLNILCIIIVTGMSYVLLPLVFPNLSR